MATSLVLAGTLRFPSAKALATWRTLSIRDAAHAAWCEPLADVTAATFGDTTVADVVARATAPDFACGRVAVRVDDEKTFSIAAALDEGDGIATWAPAIVAAARCAAVVKAKGELALGFLDEASRTTVRIAPGRSEMEPLDDDAEIARALETTTPAVELHTGARRELDPPAAPSKRSPRTAKRAEPPRAPAREKPLRWTRVASGATSTLLALARAPSGTVWAAGDGGALVTGPVEGPWTPSATGVSTAFYDLALASPSRLWVAGYEVLRSDDGGASFVRCTPRDADAAITSIWASADEAVGVDAVGRIRRTTDAGATWLVVYTHPDGAALNRIREVDGALLVLGSQGFALVSRDRGASFARLALDRAPYWVDAASSPAGRVVLGAHSVLLGDPPRDVAPKHDREVAFRRVSVHGGVIWIAHLGVLRSEDGGATWEETYARDSDFPFAVLALGPRAALIVGPRGSAWLAR